ncbi:SRPBCC family protein [Taklimakanibacter deserti]|uniref:SRPBCC family protein n=1 Tax=Taklimakanibacter deserti TaxID=2267839 RepID=UPI000E6471BF
MTQRTVEHGNFSIERRFDAPASLVFQALTDVEMKRRWFAEGDGWVTESYALDAREGGHEEGTFRYQDGPPIRNETTYLDVVDDRRLVLSYCMFIDGKRISASLATIELSPEASGTRLIYTEQAAFLDGADTLKTRKEGCEQLFDTLGSELTRLAA